MEPEQALNVIDSAISQIQTTREGHVQLQQAVQVLRTLLPVKKDKPNGTAKEK